MCGPFCGKNAVKGISAMGWRTGWYPAGSHTGILEKKKQIVLGKGSVAFMGLDIKYIVGVT
jgi:hypothetical protein